MTAEHEDTVTYGRERAHDLWDEVMPLGELHRQEIAHWKDMPLSPDIETYNGAEDLGMLRVYVARAGPALVGYAYFIVRRHLHYDAILANEDALFVHPDWRKGKVGYNLMRFAERDLRVEWSRRELLIAHHVKASTPHVAELLERMNYELVDLIYVRRFPQEG